MNSTKQLFLEETYILDGVELTGNQIKNAIIENMIYRKHFGGDEEWVLKEDRGKNILLWEAKDKNYIWFLINHASKNRVDQNI